MCNRERYMTGRWSPRKIAGIAISAMAMLTIAGPALPQLADEIGGAGIPILQLKAIVGLNNTGIGNQGAGGVQTFFSFDISWVDSQLGKYYLADRSNKSIDVIDTTTNQLTQFVNRGFAGFTGNNDTSGPDGLLTVHQPNGVVELWVGDTGSTTGQVWVLDANNPGIVLSGFPNPIPIGKGGKTRADELCFNPRDRVIIITSPAEDPPFITFISTDTHTVIGYLEFPQATNGLEQCSWSPAIGKFLQPVPEVNGPGNDSAAGAIAVVDTRNMTIDQLLMVPLSACAGPQGTAIGPGFQLMLGCNAAFPLATSTTPAGPRNTAIIDQRNGAVLSVLANLGGLDEVWFNPGDGHYYGAFSGGPLAPAPATVQGPATLGVIDASSQSLDQLVPTLNIPAVTTGPAASQHPAGTAHSVAANSKNNHVLMPLAANNVFENCLQGCIGVFGRSDNDKD